MFLTSKVAVNANSISCSNGGRIRAARFLGSLSTARVSFTISARILFSIGVHRSPFAVRRSPFAVHRSPFAVHRWEFGTPEFCLLYSAFCILFTAVCVLREQSERKKERQILRARPRLSRGARGCHPQGKWFEAPGLD